MKNSRSYVMFVCISMSILCAIAAADIKLPAVVGDQMVLQQKTSVSVWGWADPGEKVTVKGSWQWFAASTKADGSGKWAVKIKTPKAGGPYDLTIKGNNTIKLKDIMMGEVWVCSGQSNMQWPLSRANNAEAEIAAADHPDIRLFTVARHVSATPLDDCKGTWQKCSPKTVAGFSAVGYFFGRKLNKDLNIPIGLISTNWGGTPAESWTNAKTLLKMPDFADKVKRFSDTEAIEKAQQQYEKDLLKWQEDIKNIDPGMTEKWFMPELDDSAWKTVELPSLFENTEIGNFDGMVWYRKKIDIPAEMAGKEMAVSLGAIDDRDVTFFNGKKIGAMNAWNANRNYKIPGALVKAGQNTIAIRAHDTSGAGGFSGTAEQMFLQAGDKKIALAGSWLYKKSTDQRSIPRKPASTVEINSHTPSSLYNGMIHPIIQFGIRGAIWYQGESNASRAYQYRELFPAMINCWREDWGRGDFPFYFVQIAPYANQNPEIREAQFMTYRSVPNTGMAVTMDIGNPRDIHPRNKQDVGKRLALWALAKDYGKKKITYSGPLYKSFKIEGDKVRLFFDFVGGGLLAKDGPLTDFTIAGEDKKFVDAKAVIDGDTIVVSSDKVKNPVSARFGWTNTAEPNLFNKANLPASPFRTDDWPGITINNR